MSEQLIERARAFVTEQRHPGGHCLAADLVEQLLRQLGKLTEEQYLLICLAEECTEVTQRVTKQLRFGSDEVQPGQPLNNAERTAGELNDLLATHGRLIETRALPTPDPAAILAKFGKIDRYMNYSRERGTLA